MTGTITLVALCAFAACARNTSSTDETPPPASVKNGPLQFTGTASATGANDLAVNVAVENTSTAPVHMEFGACAMTVLVYRTGASPTLAWDQDRAGGGPGRICAMYQAMLDAQPGVRNTPREFSARVPVANILGDSLAAGRYGITARIGYSIGRAGDTVRVDLGTVELKR